MAFSITKSHGMHLVVPTHPALFWMVCHPSKTSPQNNMSGNPIIGFLFSPPSNYALSYLWPMTHHSCIGWVQVSSAWALRVLHFLCMLKACLLLMRLPWSKGSSVHSAAHPYLLWCELLSDLSFFSGLLLSRARPCLIVGFSPFSPFFAPSLVLLSFLPYHSTILAMVLFDPCLLGLFEPATYSSLNDSIWSLDLYSCYFELS